MPWCDDCSKFWNPPSLADGGTCASCGRTLLTRRRPIPWHFKLMLVALAVYMGYRIWWLAEWLPKHI